MRRRRTPPYFCNGCGVLLRLGVNWTAAERDESHYRCRRCRRAASRRPGTLGWRTRWHLRLGRRPTESEGAFYARLAQTLRP